MRTTLLTLAMLGAGLLCVPANADPYHWCAMYSGGRGGSDNCYFVTIEQCRAAVSGVGGFCRVNSFYDGQPVRTPGETYSTRRPRRVS
jgi:hypothetical protein